MKKRFLTEGDLLIGSTDQRVVECPECSEPVLLDQHNQTLTCACGTFPLATGIRKTYRVRRSS